jgi:hypothetical protein
MLTCFEELDSGLTAFRGVGASSSLLTTSPCLSASGVEGEGFVVVESAATTAPADSSTLGGFVLALFLDGPIKYDGRCRDESVSVKNVRIAAPKCSQKEGADKMDSSELAA